MKQDYYEILGVSKTADDKEIRSAYRRLARKYHPDLNKNDKTAEDRFKEVAEAFAVLSDKDKRAKYDRGGHEAFGPGFDPFVGFDVGQADVGLGDLSEIFEMFGFGRGGRGQRRPRRGQDLRFELAIPFVQSIKGGTVELDVPRSSESRQRVKVRIPPGIEDGGTLRLPGKGGAGGPGAPPGDAYLTVRVEPHPLFRREGRDLICDVSIGLARAALGGNIEVRTLDGSATVSLPASTRSGQRLRLAGRGVPAAAGKPAGHLYAVVQIHPPAELDERSRQLLVEFQELNPVP